jgi:hypothetical protein
MATLAAYVLFENLIFNTGAYAKIVSPDSSTGRLELMLWNEHKRPRSVFKEVLAVGDSRMGFFVRDADHMKPDLGLKFATIALPGSTPRCWYYMLRDVDPHADRYTAIVIPMADYDDEETWENAADREQDLHYLIARLRWTDLPEFAASHQDRELQFRAALGILLKGTVYKTDFQDLLLHRKARLEYANLARRESAGWYYDYVGSAVNTSGVAVDWNARTVRVPPDLPAEETSDFQGQLFAARPPYSGRRSAYLKHWLGRIYDRYRGSQTRLVFFRLPRGPFVRPDPPPFNPASSVRELAREPGVVLENEHDFDYLEKPELFQDHIHLNGPGCAEFSRTLAKHVRDLLADHAL